MALETTVLFGIFILLALGLSAMAFIFKRWVLAVLAAGAWLMNLGIVASEAPFTTNGYGFPFVGFFGIAAIVMLASIVFFRNKKEEEPKPKYNTYADFQRRINEHRSFRDGFNRYGQ